jgi:GNAT superfamily N-acetyltransferase
VPRVAVTTWYLELTDPAGLALAPAPLEGLEVRRAHEPAPEVARALYAGVGAGLWWIDRLAWDWARWHRHLTRPELEVWLPWLRGTPVGYGELAADGRAVELVSFGLLPAFTGRGIGPRFLDALLRRAWEMTDPPPERVWLRTCSLDSPPALRTYEARGLRRYAEETTEQSLPDTPPEPWPGADRPWLTEGRQADEIVRRPTSGSRRRSA